MRDAPEVATEIEPTLIENVGLRAIGIPDNRIKPTNAVLLDPESGLNATILQGNHNLGDGLVVRFHFATGETTYITTPGGSGSWSVLPVGGGEAYLGSHQQGYLYHLEAGADEVTRIDLPQPDDWIWSIDMGDDGHVYLGTYPGGEILRYDTTSGIVETLGPVLENDGRARYVRSLNADFPGKLYAGMGADPALIEYDLATGEKVDLLPAAYKNRSFVYNVDRVGDYLAALLTPHHVILLFDPATRELVHTIEIPDGSGVWTSDQQSVHEYDGRIYFGTVGNDVLWAYDLEDQGVRKIADGVGGPFGLAGGRYLFTRDYFGTYYIVDLEEEKVVSNRPTRFEGAGMEIHALAVGPGNTIVGGIYINQGFFQYDVTTDTLFAPGAAVSFGGQIDQIVTHEGLVYLAHYTTARLTVYDPKLSWNPGMKQGANPRFIAAAGNDQDRFPTAIVASDGNIYLGSVPKYGKLGGALVVHEPGTDILVTHRNVVENQAIYALVEVDGVLYGSTATVGGLGSRSTEATAKLFGWDLATQRKTFEMEPVPGVREIWGLEKLPGGHLIGGADSTLFLYDPETNAIIADTTAIPGVITKLFLSSDGWVYGLTQERFFRTTQDLQTIETIGIDSGYWDSLAETSEGRLFVSRGAGLFEVIRAREVPL